MLIIPEHLRQNVEEFRGMSDQEIQEAIKQYDSLLAQYKEEEPFESKIE